MEILGSPKYPETALRLAVSFDVLGAFIGTLVGLWDDNEESNVMLASSKRILDIQPTQLLTLRKSLAETASLTLEFLRDRFDASIAGTSGLHSSAIAGNSDQQKKLTWESPTVSLTNDPIVLAGSRVLALWIREDENAQLRTEAAGCMDVFLHLYLLNSENSTDILGWTGMKLNTEFRTHILLALEGICTVPAGVETFLAQDGWKILVSDLQACMTANAGAETLKERGQSTSDTHHYPLRVLSIIRVLLTIVESDEVAQAKESWLGFVSFLAELSPPVVPAPGTKVQEGKGHLDPVEVWTGTGQLAVALALKAPRRVQKQFRGDCDKICKAAVVLMKRGGEALDAGNLEGLEEVITGFREIKY